MENERSHESGFSGMGATAVIAVLVLVTSILWQSHAQLKDQDIHLSYLMSPANDIRETEFSDTFDDMLADLLPPSGSSPPKIGSTIAEQLLGTYVSLKEQGIYTPERGQALGNLIAPMIYAEVSHQRLTEKDIRIHLDTSKQAALAYQGALHDALAPLRKNTAPEFEFFGRYVETKNPVYLAQLRDVAYLYFEAASNSALVSVPADIAPYHVAIVNSLEQFSSVLNALSDHADEPIESVALLQSYNAAEKDVLNAFNALGYYYAQKHS
ncbi:MAG: hypothetical protein Q8R25_03050 [bacterium]|nr:hypothetical protein [bacterium]